MMITRETTIKELNDYAIESSKIVLSGETFLVKSLFREVEWNRISIENRRILGANFLLYVESQDPPIFEKLDKTSRGQQRYKKK